MLSFCVHPGIRSRQGFYGFSTITQGNKASSTKKKKDVRKTGRTTIKRKAPKKGKNEKQRPKFTLSDNPSLEEVENFLNHIIPSSDPVSSKMRNKKSSPDDPIEIPDLPLPKKNTKLSEEENALRNDILNLKSVLEGFMPDLEETRSNIPLTTTSSLSEVLKQMPEEARNEIGEKIMQFKNVLSRVPPGTQRALFLHSVVDEYIKADFSKSLRGVRQMDEITCKMGCSHCCYRLVHTTSDESTLLLQSYLALNNGKFPQEKRDQLEKQAKYGPDDDLRFWKLSDEESRCIFLSEKNTCEIYSTRPTYCRTAYVRNDPYHCSKRATFREEGEIESAVPVMAEVMYSAAVNLDGKKFQPMAKSLLEILNERDNDPDYDEKLQAQAKENYEQYKKEKKELNDDSTGELSYPEVLKAVYSEKKKMKMAQKKRTSKKKKVRKQNSPFREISEE